MAYPDPMPIVTLEWIDSHHDTGWQFPKDIERGAMLCKSSGYLFAMDEERVRIVQSQSSGGGFVDSLMDIPSVAVMSFRVLVRAEDT